MKNTTLTNIISNFNNMSEKHFVEWFRENNKVLIEKEKEQIRIAYLDGNQDGLSDHLGDSSNYYELTYNK